MADGSESLGEFIRRQHEPSEHVLDAIAETLDLSADTLQGFPVASGPCT